MNHSELFTKYRIQLTGKPITLHLKRSFNTAHSSSTTRTNFIIKTSIHHKEIQQQTETSFYGFGQCGLPPKKPHCYLSDINDCHQFFKIIQQQFDSFNQNLINRISTITNAQSILNQMFNSSLGEYLQKQNKNEQIQYLPFFTQKMQRLLQEIKNNQGQFTPQSYLYYQIFFLFNQAKQLSHKNPAFKAPRNALQFSLLDLIGNIQNKPVSELLYKNNKLKNTDNFSFYTISHEQDLQSMIQNGKDSLKFTDCIKIKFNNHIQKLIQLLQKMDSQNVGRKWIIDANASWSPEDYIKFQAIFNQISSKNPSIKQKILFLQQPFPIFKSLTQNKSQQQIEKQRNQWEQIKKNTGFIIIADESFASYEDLKQVEKYSHGINIKMEKCGGPFESLKILRQTQKNPANYIMFGSMVSTHLGCTQTFQFSEFAKYFDIDGALLVRQPQIRGGFQWRGQQGIKKVEGDGLSINVQDLIKLF